MQSCFSCCLQSNRTGRAECVRCRPVCAPSDQRRIGRVDRRTQERAEHTVLSLELLAAYGWYAHRPSRKRYLAVFALFALGLASKPMVITLPCVLLLLDYWPLKRFAGSSPLPISRLLQEKLPLLALSAASAAITMQAQQQGGAMRSTMRSRVRSSRECDRCLRNVFVEDALARQV